MSFPVRAFLRASVLWLAIGLMFGIAMGMEPRWVPTLRAVHLHALLPGFVASMIFGVAYHILPRFAGRMPPWKHGPITHFVLANAGVLLIVGGFLTRIAHPGWSRILVGSGGLLFLGGAALFIHTVWHLTGRPSWTSWIETPRPRSVSKHR